ncbi:MAG: two-component regulator propeller domain-containing protein, partial [Bacteroidota bacterium]
MEFLNHALLKKDEETLLLGNRGLTVYDIPSQDYRVIYNKDRSITHPIWSIFCDQHQNYWLGSEYGLRYWDGHTDHIDSYSKYNTFPELKEHIVYTFLEWDAQHLIIGSTAGIYILHQEKGIIHRFWDEGAKGFYLPNNSIYHLHKDTENVNTIWVGTGGGGLIRIHLNEHLSKIDAYRQFTTLDGLSNNTIYSVYEDDHQNLWMSSNYGIIRFNKNNFSSKAFTEEDGISHHEFNRISHYQDETGNLYFGGLNGITSFHPDNVRSEAQKREAPLRITGFEQYDGEQQRVVDKTIDLIQQKAIILQPADKLFNLEFALL